MKNSNFPKMTGAILTALALAGCSAREEPPAPPARPAPPPSDVKIVVAGGEVGTTLIRYDYPDGVRCVATFIGAGLVCDFPPRAAK